MGRPLGVLNPNNDLNTLRGISKRAPIAAGQENVYALRDGLARGTYVLEEVLAIDDWRTNRHQAATGEQDEDSGYEGDAPLHTLAMDDDEEGGYDNDDADMGDDLAGDEDGDVDDDYDEDIGDEDVDDEDVADEEEDEEEMMEDDDAEAVAEVESIAAFDPAALGLKEINNLAHFGVSSHKPGNGVAELLSDDLDKYWQSDGQQPHLLTIHFLRRVEIRAIRFYVDYSQDESYTPTNLVFYAGTGPHDLIRFAEVALSTPVGWQDVPAVADAGGGPDGHSLCCWLVQVHVKENHQNGKDTHLRGIKLYAIDEQRAGNMNMFVPHSDDGNNDNEDDYQDSSPVPVPTPEDVQSGLEALEALHALDVAAGRVNGSGVSSVPAYMHDMQIR